MEQKKLADYLSPQANQSLQTIKKQEIVIANKDITLLKHAKYFKFQDKYRDNWVGFAEDCIIWKEGEKGLVEYQNRILNNWKIHNRQAIMGPRGLGKTGLAAISTHAFALTLDGEDWKVITTASSWRQLEEYLWPEIHKWAKRIRWDIVGRDPYNMRTELLTQQLRLETGKAFPVTSDDPEATEGAHADHLFVIFDEAKIIPDEIWDAAEGAFSAGEDDADQHIKVMAISTPGSINTRFYKIHTHAPGLEDWHTEAITKDEVIAAGRMSQKWADRRKRQWGETSPLYINHVLGEFSEGEEDTIIPLSWINAAVERFHLWERDVKNGAPKGRITSAGCDIGLGGEGGDKTTLAKVYDNRIVDRIETWARGREDTATMQTAGRLAGFINSTGSPVWIDAIGAGVGVYNRLRELKYTNTAIAFVSSKKTKRKDKTKSFGFRNLRSAMWWLGREMLDPTNGYNICLPPSKKMIAELMSPKYEILSNAVIAVEKKEDIRKRIKRSTDEADAVLMALTGPILANAARTMIYVPGEGYID